MKSYHQLTHAVAGEVSAWIEARDECRPRLFLSKADRMRLLRLRIWGIRYKISVSEILDLILPALRKKAGGRSRGGLGISVATLTGRIAEEILQDRLFRRYPGGENIGAWKEAERERQLAAEERENADGMDIRERPIPTLLEVGDIGAYSLAYVERTRREREAQLNQRWRKRKRYRDNPWN